MNGGKAAKYGHHLEMKYFLFRLFYVIRKKDEGILTGFDIEYRPKNNSQLPEIDFYIKLQLNRDNKNNIIKNYYEIKSGDKLLSKNEVIKTIKNFWQINNSDKDALFNLCYQHKTKGYLTIIPFLGYRWRNNANIFKGKGEAYKGFIQELCRNLRKKDISFYKRINKSFFEKINLVPIDVKVDYEFLTKLILKDALNDISVVNNEENVQNLYNAVFKDMFNYIDQIKTENYSEGLDYYLIDKQPLLKNILDNEKLCQSLIVRVANKMDYTES